MPAPDASESRPDDSVGPLVAADGNLLAVVADAIPSLISYLTPEGRYKFCNRAYLDWFGKTPDQVIGRRVVEIAGESMWRASEPRFREALAGRAVQYEVEAHYPQGPRRWVHVSYTPHRLPDGTIAGVVAMVSDITARKSAEEAAHTAEERMQLAMGIADAGTWDYDITTGKLHWSDSHFRMLGLEPTPDGEATMEMWQSRFPPEDLARFQAERQRAEREHGTLSSVHRIRRYDGQLIWARAAGRFIYDDRGKPLRFVGVFYDITASKLAEERLEQLVRERTAALRVKLEELEAFSYSLSHDLRGPLRSMYGFAKILIEEHAHRLEPDAQEYLRRIERGAQRLDQLVREVLAYSHVTKGEFELVPVDLGTVINDVVHALDIRSAEVHIEPSLPKVFGHAALLAQTFSNLIDNAAKFGRRDGRAVVRVYARPAGAFVRVIVEDEGIGIASEHFDRIFEIFGRVHPENEYPGTGIGLAIVKKAAERMGGTVGLESEVDRGTRLWVDLRPAKTADG